MKQAPEEQKAKQIELAFFRARKLRLKRFRDARRLKNAHLLVEVKDSNEPSATKQDRKEKQMIKNRQSAQINRDRKKSKLQELENKIIQYQKLIKQLSSGQVLCSHCKQNINRQKKQEMEIEHIESQDYYPINNSDDILDDFERVRNQQRFGFNFFFTVLTISMCLMFGMTTPYDTPYDIEVFESKAYLHSRFLQTNAYYSINFLKQFQIQSSHKKFIHLPEIKFRRVLQLPINSKAKSAADSSNQTNKVAKQTSLVLISRNYTKTCKVRQVTNFNETCAVTNSTMTCLEHIHNCTISTQNSKKAKNLSYVKKETIGRDVLFCELPRIYRYNKTQNKLLNGEFSLMLDGNSLKQIFMDGQGFHLYNQSFSGFYEVKVNVENIKPINRNLCNLSHH